MFTREKLLERAQTGIKENRTLDFKAFFDPKSARDWCEIIKDIVAFANGGGGAIVFGLNDNILTPSAYDRKIILSIDPADITNKIEKYTGVHFADFEVLEVIRNEGTFAVMLIFGVNIPIVFRKPGTYPVEGGKQKNAFSQGTVYFRHGSKSEPSIRDDLHAWLQRELANVREQWISGVRKVVEAPPGHMIQVVSAAPAVDENVPIRIVNDLNALPLRPQNPDKIWPCRQTDVLQLVNKCLPEGVSINGHDILCIRHAHGITPKDRPDFIYRSHPNFSPQYSHIFVNWIVEQYRKDASFFANARTTYRDRTNC